MQRWWTLWRTRDVACVDPRVRRAWGDTARLEDNIAPTGQCHPVGLHARRNLSLPSGVTDPFQMNHEYPTTKEEGKRTGGGENNQHTELHAPTSAFITPCSTFDIQNSHRGSAASQISICHLS